MSARRVALVAGAALVAAGLPVLAGWGAGLAAGPEDARPEVPLLLALGAAPVVAVLGAAAAAAWLGTAARAAARPLRAALGALCVLPGMLLGVYLHMVFRARIAGAAGLPPFALMFRLDDFARVVPLVPVGLMLGAVLGPLPRARTPLVGLALAFGVGLALALGAGIATLLPLAVASVVGGPVMFALFGALAVAVAVLAGRGARSR